MPKCKESLTAELKTNAFIEIQYFIFVKSMSSLVNPIMSSAPVDVEKGSLSQYEQEQEASVRKVFVRMPNFYSLTCKGRCLPPFSCSF